MVHDLHREPVLARPALVVQHERRCDAAGDLLVRCADLAEVGGTELGEGLLKEVEVTGRALGAFIDDLYSV